MRVNSINNVSFGAKKTDKENKDQYYKYISQLNANNALKMSVGREVEDGKFKSAANTTFLAGFVGSVASIIASSNIAVKARNMLQDENVTEKAIQSLKTKNKIANIGFWASTVAVLASLVIRDINESRAEKTANERGFLSNSDYSKLKSRQQVYAITDFVNKTRIN